MDIDGTVRSINLIFELYWPLFRNFGIVYAIIVGFRRLIGI